MRDVFPALPSWRSTAADAGSRGRANGWGPRRPSFLVALLLAALTAGSYAELATKYPRAGGAALYAKKAFGSPLIAFLVAFAVVASGVTSASALARAFGGDYLAEFVAVPVAAAGQGEPHRAVELREGATPALAILGGGALAFYALIGFEDSVNIAEETTRPERSYPLALFTGLAAAGLPARHDPGRGRDVGASRSAARCRALAVGSAADRKAGALNR